MFLNIRLIQIFSLLSLLSLGALYRDFSISTEQIALTFISGVLTQYFFTRLLKIKRAGLLLSPVITCFGIALLLRSDCLWIHPLAACLAISSKFIIRYNKKHLFNPANIGVLFAALVLPGAWVSSGQWGSDVAFAFLFFALGSTVVFKAKMATSAIAFFVSYFLIWASYRNLYLGFEWTVLFHQLSSGSLLLFTFFMVSDPKTSPNSEKAKIIHGVIVACVAHIISYYFYYPNGVLLALLLSTPLVPFLDKTFLAKRYYWKEEVFNYQTLKENQGEYKESKNITNVAVPSQSFAAIS